jgi:hypothetical protein
MITLSYPVTANDFWITVDPALGELDSIRFSNQSPYDLDIACSGLSRHIEAWSVDVLDVRNAGARIIHAVPTLQSTIAIAAAAPSSVLVVSYASLGEKFDGSYPARVSGLQASTAGETAAGVTLPQTTVAIPHQTLTVAGGPAQILPASSPSHVWVLVGLFLDIVGAAAGAYLTLKDTRFSPGPRTYAVMSGAYAHPVYLDFHGAALGIPTLAMTLSTSVDGVDIAGMWSVYQT